MTLEYRPVSEKNETIFSNQHLSTYRSIIYRGESIKQSNVKARIQWDTLLMLLAFPPKYFSPLHFLPITRLSENTFFYILLLNTSSIGIQKRLKFGHGTEKSHLFIYPFPCGLLTWQLCAKKVWRQPFAFFQKGRKLWHFFTQYDFFCAK